MSKRLLLGFLISITIVCFLVCCLSATAESSSGSQDVSASSLDAKYKDKLVWLRNFYCGRKLRFDTAGELVSGGKPGPWTLCRDIKIHDLHIRDGKLRINGQRVYLVYDARAKRFRDVNDIESDGFKKTRIHLEKVSGQQISIEIGSLPQVDDAAIAAIMAHLFYTSEAEFSEAVPDYWKKVIGSMIGPQSNPGVRPTDVSATPPAQKPDSSPNDKTSHVGNGVTAPRAIQVPDPSYSEEASKAKFQGTLVMTVIVGPDGQVHHPVLTRPLGMGLDEKAIERVLAWKFAPATKDGKPVAVEVSVEVTFNLY